MNIDNLMFQAGSDIYYDPAFRNVLEDHMTVLRNSPNTTTQTVPQMSAYVFEYDFFGLLATFNIPPYLHWLTMRMNKMTSPSENRASLTTFLSPDPEEVDKIRGSYTSTRVIT